MEPGYCLDTSALIELWRGDYDRNVFRKAWSAFNQAIDDGLIVAPREVLREIEQGDDDLAVWTKDKISIFIVRVDEKDCIAVFHCFIQFV